MGRMVVAHVALLVALTLGILAGCGGGGGGPVQGPPVQISGSYFFHYLGLHAGPPTMGTSVWGTFSGDGVNMVTGGTTFANAGGALFGPTVLAAFPYVAGPDAALTLGWTVPLSGGFAVDGSVMVLGSVTPGEDPGIGIALRRQGTFSTSSLNGDYHLVAVFTNGTLMSDASWYRGTASFDGAGNATAEVDVNTGGTITPGSGPVPFGSYAVASDGTITWSGPLGFELSGGMLEGGELVVVSGLTTALNLQFLAVLIKKGVGLSNTTLHGSYRIAFLRADLTPPPRYDGGVGGLEADGLGTTSGGGTALLNSDGMVTSSSASSPLTYLVSGDGSLTLPMLQLFGAVSSSGRFAALAGIDAPTAPPYFIFLAR